jgi:tetratricopeptide (TPR) repeat protein
MKTNSYRTYPVCFASLTILLFALPCLAQDSSIQVTCADAAGSLLPGVKVVVTSIGNSKSKDKKSDDKGIAEFAKLEDGTYRVVGRKDGFEPAFYEYAVLKASKESVALKFQPGADKKLYFEDPALAQQAASLLKQGLDAFKQGKPADAEKLLQQSIDLNPSGTDAIYYLGVMYLQQSRYDQGVEVLNRAVKMAGILAAMPPAPGQPAAQHQQVGESAKQLLKRLPAIKGDNALKQKKYDIAAAEFSEAVKSDPNNPDFQYNLALALAFSQKYDDAKQALSKAIQLNPAEKAYPDLMAKITALKEKGDIEKAQAILIEGNKLLQDGDAAGALKKFEESRAMVPQDKQAVIWRQIGRAQDKLNQPAAAVEAFKKSMELAPADKIAEYRNTFAQFYVDNKKFDEAIGLLIDPKAAGSPSEEPALIEMAEAWKNKEPKLSEAALERVIKLNPQNTDIYFDLGRMYYADGKEKDSRTKELLTKYVEIGKDADKVGSAKDMLIIVNKRSK